MIHYKCPKCGEDMRSPREKLGELEDCPNCLASVTVPRPLEGVIGPLGPRAAIMRTLRHWRTPWRRLGQKRIVRLFRHWQMYVGLLALILLLLALFVWPAPFAARTPQATLVSRSTPVPASELKKIILEPGKLWGGTGPEYLEYRLFNGTDRPVQEIQVTIYLLRPGSDKLVEIALKPDFIYPPVLPDNWYRGDYGLKFDVATNAKLRAKLTGATWAQGGSVTVTTKASPLDAILDEHEARKAASQGISPDVLDDLRRRADRMEQEKDEP